MNHEQVFKPPQGGPDDSNNESIISEMNEIDVTPEDDVLGYPESQKLFAAIQEMIDSLEENEVWRIVLLPPGQKPIKSKLVFVLKRN